MMWETVKLGDVAKAVGGNGFPKKYQLNTDKPIPFYKVSDMNIAGNEIEMHSANNYVDDNDLREIKAKWHPKGTIIFPKIGGAISTNKKRLLKSKAAFDNNVVGIIPNKSLILPEFLYKIFLSLDLYELSNKAALPSITNGAVENIDILLPPLEEQQRIVAKLDAAFAKINESIAACEFQLSKLKNLNQRIFDGEFDTESNLVEFENIVSEKVTGLERRANLQGSNKAFPYLKMNNITSQNTLNTDKYTTVDASEDEVKKYTLYEGDFLFNTRNSVELVGKTAVVSGLDGWLFNNNILRVKFIKGINADYINYFFCTSGGKQQLNLKKTGTTNVAAVYYKDLKEIKIPIIEEGKQEDIVRKLKAIEENASLYWTSVSSKISNLQNLKSAILLKEFQNKAA